MPIITRPRSATNPRACRKNLQSAACLPTSCRRTAFPPVSQGAGSVRRAAGTISAYTSIRTATSCARWSLRACPCSTGTKRSRCATTRCSPRSRSQKRACRSRTPCQGRCVTAPRRRSAKIPTRAWRAFWASRSSSRKVSAPSARACTSSEGKKNLPRCGNRSNCAPGSHRRTSLKAAGATCASSSWAAGRWAACCGSRAERISAPTSPQAAAPRRFR